MIRIKILSGNVPTGSRASSRDNFFYISPGTYFHWLVESKSAGGKWDFYVRPKYRLK